jgi:hypothetical protein
MAIINKNGITDGGTIQAEHVTRAIDALSGGSTDTIIATGSLFGTASFALTASYISGSGADTNFANTNLTFTGNRSHNTNGNFVEISTDNSNYEEAWFYLDRNGASNLGTWIGWGDNYIRTFNNGIQYITNDNQISQTGSQTTFNATGQDVNFRINGIGTNPIFFMSGSQNRIGINKATPTATLDVSGSVLVTGSLQTTSTVRFPAADITGQVATTTLQVDNVYQSTTAFSTSGNVTGFTTFDLSSYGIAHVTAKIIGRTIQEPVSGSSTILMATFLYSGSAAIQIGSTTQVHHQSTLGASAPLLDANGVNARVRVSGVTAKNITWYTSWEISYS